MLQLEKSYQVCQRIARQSASNFYWSFRLLPKPKRRAMYALYAFARRTDDLADSDQPKEERRAALRQWRYKLENELDGTGSESVLIALADAVARYEIPQQYLFDIVDGVTIDTTDPEFATFAELEHYCHLVASAVGLACLHIWGFSNPHAVDHATDCGTAFQLTNILRDLQEDAHNGRIYLPTEDLHRFGVSKTDIEYERNRDQLEELLRFEVNRAATYYASAAKLIDMLHPDGRRMLRLMTTTYGLVLKKVRRRGSRLHQPVRISRFERLAIASSIFGIAKLPLIA